MLQSNHVLIVSEVVGYPAFDSDQNFRFDVRVESHSDKRLQGDKPYEVIVGQGELAELCGRQVTAGCEVCVDGAVIFYLDEFRIIAGSVIVTRTHKD